MVFYHCIIWCLINAQRLKTCLPIVENISKGTHVFMNAHQILPRGLLWTVCQRKLAKKGQHTSHFVQKIVMPGLRIARMILLAVETGETQPLGTGKRKALLQCAHNHAKDSRNIIPIQQHFVKNFSIIRTSMALAKQNV